MRIVKELVEIWPNKVCDTFISQKCRWDSKCGRSNNTPSNPEIDWEKEEVRMTRCPPICGKKKQKEERKEVKKAERDENKEVLRKLVPKRFWRWKKVFGKKELERMPVRKAWNHVIELKEGFVSQKEKVYSLSREERKKVQAFVEDQLRKGYI